MASYWSDQDIRVEFFSPNEFDHPEMMNGSFLLGLDRWRALCGFPIYITGDGRTEEEHRRLYTPNPAPDSAHPKGLAVDCKLPQEGKKRLLMMKYAIQLYEENVWPYLGLEVATRHIHVENYRNPAFDRPTVWAGVSK